MERYVEWGRGGVYLKFKPGYTKETVLKTKKGNRPSPQEYLYPDYISQHLSKFNEGAAYLVPKSSLDKFGRSLVGRPDGQFVMTKKEMDALLQSANGDLSIIEKELGLPPGAWAGNEIVRIDVKNPKEFNVRLPSGNEAGANEFWIPGGVLPNGKLEAVIDQIPQGKYTEEIITIK